MVRNLFAAFVALLPAFSFSQTTTTTQSEGYIISSPSIWWNNREVLADEEAFAKRARSGELRLKIVVTSAGDEQYRGSDPKILDADRRMVDNASELATRLSALDRSRIKVVRTIFEGETHGSVSPVSLTRGLRFALALD